MTDSHLPSKPSTRTKYFVALFAVFFTVMFVKFHFFNAWGVRSNPAILRENDPAGKAAALALVLALFFAYLLTKKKFG
jgi:hypothetical protein